jgi:hypothetical protein
MPPHTRSQRRRQQQRSAARPAASANRTPPIEVVEQPAQDMQLEVLPAPVTTPAEPRAATARTPRAGRRAAAKAYEPLDYSQDYAAARHDLLRIAIIGALLLVTMIGLSVAGVF